jgi:hypothetical protein
MLLEDGANPASNMPLFGEPLAMAASSGSLAIVHLLLDHWDWENYLPLSGLRLINAIEAAAAAGHGCVLAKLLDYKDRIARSAYDNAIVRMIECNQTASAERLLVLRQVDLIPAAKAEFWLCLVRTAAEYDRRALLQRVLTEHLPDIGEASLVVAMKDACLENHGQILQILIPHVSVSDPAHHADSLFWAAWFGNVEALQHLLTFLQNDRRALLLAFAGAVSGKASIAIVHLFKIAGISPSSKGIATRFTDIARLMLSDTASSIIAEPTEPLSASVYERKLRAAAKTGELADVINVSNALQAHHPNNVFRVSAAISDAANYNHLDILLFLCENWTPHLIASRAKSPAAAQVCIDFGWDVSQTDKGSKYPRLG